MSHAARGETNFPTATPPLDLMPHLPVTLSKLMVHIVDDDEAVRRSLAMLLASFGVQAQTHIAAEALLQQLASLPPGCIIIDVRMPGMDGLELQTELRRRGCNMPVIVVTGHADVGLAVRAMKAGAIDFIEKPYSEDDVLHAVCQALEQGDHDRQSSDAVHAAQARINTLSPRERDVLTRLVDGFPNKVIAHHLGISPRTVEIHRANVMEKMACRSVAEAVRIALAAGFPDAN